MKKCPSCNHKLYGEEGGKRYCKFCGYSNKSCKEIGVPKMNSIVHLPKKKDFTEKILEIARKSIDECETFCSNFEEDVNAYAKIKQEKDTVKILKRFISRMNRIRELILEENMK